MWTNLPVVDSSIDILFMSLAPYLCLQMLESIRRTKKATSLFAPIITLTGAAVLIAVAVTDLVVIWLLPHFLNGAAYAELSAGFDRIGSFAAPFAGASMMLGLLVVITEKLDIDSQLSDSRELLAETGEIVRVGGWELVPQTMTVKWTDVTYDIHELDRNVQPPLEDAINFYEPQDRPVIEQAVNRAINEARPYDLELKLITGKGNRLWVRTSCRPQVDRNGKVVKLIGTFQDITQRKLAEEEIRRNTRLESLGVLAGGIAHDFNNILTMFFGNVALAKTMVGRNSPAWPELENAEAALQRASRLTRRLLTFAKGGLPVKTEVRLDELVPDLIKFDLSGSAVSPIFQIDADLNSANVDEGQIEQVISNLTINAIQAMPAGGELRVQLENETLDQSSEIELTAGDYIKLTFSDQGTGIEPEILERIFDPFFSTKASGSGLGLSTAHSIIKNHGGHIGVESKLREGTTFIIHLPATSDNSETSSNEIARRPEQPRSDANPRVLVMDDEARIRDMVVQVLEAIGYEVSAVADGRAAIEAYRESLEQGRRYDGVILDLTVVGGLGGREAIGEILKADPSANVIVSSGYTDDAIMADYRRYGFSGVLHKPYSLQALQQELEKSIDHP